MNFNKEEIIYHAVNSMIAGALVFLGYFIGAGEIISIKGIFISMAAAGMVAVTKFKDYWQNEADVLEKPKKKKTTKRHHLLTFY